MKKYGLETSGKYLLEVKNEYGDGSYDYYFQTLKVAKIDIRVPISAISQKKLEREGLHARDTKDKITYTYDENNKLITEERRERYGRTKKLRINMISIIISLKNI